MNHLSRAASTRGAVPSARTCSARSSHIAGGPNRGALQHTTNLSTRSGCSAASHMAISPPRDSPAKAAPARAQGVE